MFQGFGEFAVADVDEAKAKEGDGGRWWACPCRGRTNSARFCLVSRCELCELVLIEIYILLRNPATSAKPLRAAEATRKIQNLRENPAWALLDYPGTLMDEIWRHAASLERYRGIFDVRFALTLRYHGVKRFATVNIRDFKSFEI